jgi:hypothetical protein
MPTALEKADALFAKSDEALRRGRPNSSPADSRRKSMERKTRRKKWTSPGPGAYNVDDSKVGGPSGILVPVICCAASHQLALASRSAATGFLLLPDPRCRLIRAAALQISAVTGNKDMCMGRHGKGGPRFSFGTASRDDDGSKVYLGSGHNKASSMFGHQSPGPATYNTRNTETAPGFRFTKDTDRCAAALHFATTTASGIHLSACLAAPQLCSQLSGVCVCWALQVDVARSASLPRPVLQSREQRVHGARHHAGRSQRFCDG